MKITKTTVKTISTIILDTVDFACMIEDYKKSDYYKGRYPNAFKDMCVTAEMPESNVLRVMEEMFILANKDTFNFIAEINGFDGWENAGIYNKKTNTYKMVVFSYGDTLNK